ncbi:MAG: hypothetical protein RDU20_08780 [Desulfomonilaceae bacterium]|nr:hypothetical protein [Desulfomonilaceae bacterium]
MLIRSEKYWFLFVIFALTIVAATASPAAADSLFGFSEGYKGVSKIRPSSSEDVLKVKPWGVSAGLRGLSSLNPATWGLNCFLPTPAKGQFMVYPEILFARIGGEARRGVTMTGLEQPHVDFDDNLGFSKGGHTVWSVNALYQFRPRFALTYSFMPMTMEASGTSLTGFQFGGQSFMAGAQLNSKWERYAHRAGINFNVIRRANASTSLFAQWLYLQDRLSIRDGAGTSPGVSWDDDKNLAVLGIRFDKCLRNYRGNTLALNIAGGVAFLDDTMGYEADAGLSYLIPIKKGRFGFVKGGYKYSYLKKENDLEMLGTTMDGAYLQLGFLF